MVKGPITYKICGDSKYLTHINKCPARKRTKKYLSLRNRLLSIHSNIFKTESFTESINSGMRCFVCMEKGAGKDTEKRCFCFFLSESSNRHTHTHPLPPSYTWLATPQMTWPKMNFSTPNHFYLVPSGNKSTISHELTESSIFLIRAHKTL